MGKKQKEVFSKQKFIAKNNNCASTQNINNNIININKKVAN